MPAKKAAPKKAARKTSQPMPAKTAAAANRKAKPAPGPTSRKAKAARASVGRAPGKKNQALASTDQDIRRVADSLKQDGHRLTVGNINAGLKVMGKPPIDAARRDQVLGRVVHQVNKDKRGTNGGARQGAGRKKGAATEKTRKIADKLAEDGGVTPLEYMLEVLRETPDKLRAELKAGKIERDEFLLRLKMLTDRRDWAAEKAAPYIHPRLASIDATVKKDEHAEWLALMEAAGL